MKSIEFSQHALDQLVDRGATKEEVVCAIERGELVPAKLGRKAFRKNFAYEAKWKGIFYEVKQVLPIVVDEGDHFVVITVYTYYFGGEQK